jgi:hypothetical protein
LRISSESLTKLKFSYGLAGLLIKSISDLILYLLPKLFKIFFISGLASLINFALSFFLSLKSTFFKLINKGLYFLFNCFICSTVWLNNSLLFLGSFGLPLVPSSFFEPFF